MNTSLEGMTGEPLPYLIQSDGRVTTLMFLCILMVSFAFSREKKYLLQQARSLFINRERSSMFDETNIIDVRCFILLILHTCIILGFCLYGYFTEKAPVLFEKIPHMLLLGGFIGLIPVYLFIKWILYGVVNWTFFQKVKNSAWTTSFFNLFIWLGILLLPLVLLVVYLDISSPTNLYLIGFVVIIAKISLFWKSFSNFFEKIHGAFHLILYFCALEILPDFVLWKGIELVSNNLILKL